MHKNVKDYYDAHLSHFYSWMAGDFKTRVEEFHTFIRDHNLGPRTNRVAYDLGAGHGIQAVALAQAGYRVVAIDFNERLLSELKVNAQELDVELVTADLREAPSLLAEQAGLILCWGDTLTHLDDIAEVRALLLQLDALLGPGGRLVLSFRDYTTATDGKSRVIPVKSDKNRILTCFLEYQDHHVVVTDLLYEWVENQWIPRVMSYRKARLEPKVILEILNEAGLHVIVNQTMSGMVTLIASKNQ
jgi:2-polyprenyl-3-methyl-5-hydroxy-6-metoxy-1,4-benzoquinol methylase